MAGPRKRGNGEGTIVKRSDGRWQGAALVPSAAGGSTRRFVYGHTRQEAARKLTELLRQAQQGLPAPVAKLTVADYLEAWLTEVAAHKVRSSTYRGYAMNVRTHLVPGLGRRKLARLSASDVRAFLHAKREAGLSQATVRQLHGILRSALSHAVREDLVPRNVAKLVQVSTGPRYKVRPLDIDEARQLLNTARDDRLYALWAVALGVGLRRGEALGLRWSDVDLDAGTLRVEQTLQRTPAGLVFVPPKSERSQRTVPLPPICVAALKDHRTRQLEDRLAAGPAWHEMGLVFTTSIGTPIEPRNVSRAFTQLCQRAGLRHVRLHDLRHTCASLLLAQGVDARVVMETLGHSQISVTMNTYQHVMPVVQREAAQRINDALIGRG